MRALRVFSLGVLLSLGACGSSREELAVEDRSGESVDFGAKLEPASGRVLHGWGQFSGAWTLGLERGRGDAADLRAYEQATAPAAPALLSFYVAPTREQIEALLPKLAELRAERGAYVVQLGLYFFSLQDALARGDLDAELRALAVGLRELRLPVLLRIGYEFNNPWQPYRPESYVPAFQRVVRLLAESGACNVAPVWHASVLGLSSRAAQDWYPGDELVAWWGVSLFHSEELTSAELGPFLDAAREHRRPVLVAEASPVLASRIPFRVRGPDSPEEAQQWYARLFALVERRPEIKALSLIAVDWRRLREDLPGLGWPDTRLGAWPEVAAQVRRELSSPRYLSRAEWQLTDSARADCARSGS
jgi:hypothetical protein